MIFIAMRHFDLMIYLACSMINQGNNVSYKSIFLAHWDNTQGSIVSLFKYVLVCALFLLLLKFRKWRWATRWRGKCRETAKEKEGMNVYYSHFDWHEKPSVIFNAVAGTICGFLILTKMFPIILRQLECKEIYVLKCNFIDMWEEVQNFKC